MRTLHASFLLLALVSAAAGPALATSRAAPQHRQLVARDGQTYLLVNVLSKHTVRFERAEFLLVRRTSAAALPALPVEATAWDAPALAPAAGDEVLVRQEGLLPVDARCLNGAQGWLAVDCFARPGSGNVLERRDARGGLLWQRTLEDLFTAEERTTFPRLDPELLIWHQASWLDAEAGDVVVLATGARLRRVALKDGTRRASVDIAGTLLAQVARAGDGGAQAQRAALAAAEALVLEGLAQAMERGLSDAATDPLLRSAFAERLLAAGDHPAALDFFLEALKPTQPQGGREWTADALRPLLSKRSPAFLERARARLRAVDSPEARALLASLR